MQCVKGRGPAQKVTVCWLLRDTALCFSKLARGVGGSVGVVKFSDGCVRGLGPAQEVTVCVRPITFPPVDLIQGSINSGCRSDTRWY